jgi:hypothetical protein
MNEGDLHDNIMLLAIHTKNRNVHLQRTYCHLLSIKGKNQLWYKAQTSQVIQHKAPDLGAVTQPM